MCPHAMLCGLCKIVQCNAWMRFHHFIQLGVKCTTDKSMCIQVWWTFAWSTATLYLQKSIQLVAIFEECMHNQRKPESLLSEEVLMMHSPTTGWRNSSDTCLQEWRPKECGAVAKSQCWSQPHDQGEYYKKQYLLQFLTLDNIWIIFLLLLYHRAKRS